MKFQLTEDQKMIRDSVREFAQRRILPNRMIWDEDQIFPRDVFEEMGEIGLMGMLVPGIILSTCINCGACEPRVLRWF